MQYINTIYRFKLSIKGLFTNIITSNSRISNHFDFSREQYVFIITVSIIPFT